MRPRMTTRTYSPSLVTEHIHDHSISRGAEDVTMFVDVNIDVRQVWLRMSDAPIQARPNDVTST